MILWQMADWQTPDSVKVTLRYHGPSVEDGTMEVSDVLAALHGFSGAYGKIASRQTPELEHTLRVAAIKTSSFDLGIVAFALLAQEPNRTALLQIATHAVKQVISTISQIIAAKKHTKGAHYAIDIRGNNNQVNVTNAEGATITMSLRDFELFESQIVDSELGRIASPLQKGSIDSAELLSDGVDEKIEAAISETEKPYFDKVETTTNIIKETKLEGFLVSLNKERNRGSFRLQNGTAVPYQYAGDDPSRFHADFSYRGPVRVTCEAVLDESLHPIRLAIKAVERLQQSFPFQADSSSDKPQT